MSENRPFYARRAQRPGIVFQPSAQENIRKGINTLVAAIRPTLGPTARTVAVTPLAENMNTPEILDNGGLIARRVIELHQREQDMGAMLARALVCRQHDSMGDGSATTAVLFQAIFNGGLHYLAAGGNPMRLRHYLEKSLHPLLRQLDELTRPVKGKLKLAQVARSICFDDELARLLGEIFDIIGAFGRLDIRKDNGRKLRREYLEGMAWDSGLFSRDMIADRAQLQTVYEEPALALADFKVNDPRHLMPLLEIAVERKIEKLVLVAGDLSAEAIAGLLMANGKLKDFEVMAVRLPGQNDGERLAAIEDLAIATGARPLIKDAGYELKDISFEHLGRARRVWAGPHNFGIIGGKGDPRQLRRHVSKLQAQLTALPDVQDREKLVKRIGRLLGGSATLWIGGASETEIERRKALAENTAAALRTAVSDGVLPGAGSAYLHCRNVLREQMINAADTDERAAYRILTDALAEPARAIYENAGYEPGEILARLANAENGYGFDVLRDRVAGEESILDCAAVLKAALKHAVHTAAMVLTVDVMVHHRTPEIARQPG